MSACFSRPEHVFGPNRARRGRAGALRVPNPPFGAGRFRHTVVTHLNGSVSARRRVAAPGVAKPTDLDTSCGGGSFVGGGGRLQLCHVAGRAQQRRWPEVPPRAQETAHGDVAASAPSAISHYGPLSVHATAAAGLSGAPARRVAYSRSAHPAAVAYSRAHQTTSAARAVRNTRSTGVAPPRPTPVVAMS